jgi:hypothetical protein
MKNIRDKIFNFLSEDPFILEKNKKKKKFLEIIRYQIKHHKKNCKSYSAWYKKNNLINPDKIKNYEDIPFIPSAVFKNVELKSIKNKGKIISSSGSSGHNKSSIYIDSTTSNFQKICLSKILTNTIGKDRRIFFIADVEPKESFSQRQISARYAGMSGYLLAAKERNYLFKLNNNNEIEVNYNVLKKLNNIIAKEPIVIIGYTYMIYDHVIKNKNLLLKNLNCHKDTKLIHFGGWKKLHNIKVSKNEFNEKVSFKLKLKNNSILDIYGFSEQLGTIYVSAGSGGCRVSNYSHILIRDPKTLKVLEDGNVGYMQFLSVLPLSYPGFSILNDDMGFISKRSFRKNIEKIEFKVHSRLDKLEMRGCGDTLPDHYYI